MKQKLGTKAISVTPDPARIEELLGARGISGVSVEDACKRFVRYIASDEKLDSMDDVILADGWDVKEWLSSPAMFADHNHSVEAMVARGLNAGAMNGQLLVDCFYLPADIAPNGLAEACFKMVQAGILTDCSIGAIPTKTRYPDEADKAKFGKQVWRIWEGALLKEVSCVGIGANARAKVEAVAKAFHDRVLTESDMTALQGSESEYLIDMVERAMVRISPKTISVPAPPVAPDFGAILKQMQDTTERLEESRKALEVSQKTQIRLQAKEAAGLVLPLTQEDAEAILTYNDAIAETIRKYIPSDDSSEGDSSTSDTDPEPPYEENAKATELQSVVDAAKQLKSTHSK
jgi:hypothetical protein